MGVSKNSVLPPKSSHFNGGFSMIFTIHFGVFPLFSETPIYIFTNSWSRKSITVTSSPKSWVSQARSRSSAKSWKFLGSGNNEPSVTPPKGGVNPQNHPIKNSIPEKTNMEYIEPVEKIEPWFSRGEKPAFYKPPIFSLQVLRFPFRKVIFFCHVVPEHLQQMMIAPSPQGDRLSSPGLIWRR